MGEVMQGIGQHHIMKGWMIFSNARLWKTNQYYCEVVYLGCRSKCGFLAKLSKQSNEIQTQTQCNMTLMSTFPHFGAIVDYLKWSG